jgi:probable phosphoglycerate mutase
MSIYLIRHGETLLNVARTLQPADTPLSRHGRAQAEAVAHRMCALGITDIVSSDLPRAWETAQAIARATGLVPSSTPLLQERNFGDLRGKGYDELGFNPLTMDDAPPNGESSLMFRDRVAAAFAHVVQRRAAGRGSLAVITHGLVIHALLERQVRLAEGMVLPLRLGNTSVTVVGHEAPHGVELLDCMQHLETNTRDDIRSLSGG